MAPQLTIDEFLRYVRAFNAKDYEQQHSFYTEDVTLLIPEDNFPLLVGSDGIKAHYTPLHKVFDEVLVPMEIMINERRVMFIMETYFRSKKAVKAGIANMDFEAGDICRVVVWALYDMVGDKMQKITCNLLRAEFFGQKQSLESLIKESQSRAAPGISA